MVGEGMEVGVQGDGRPRPLEKALAELFCPTTMIDGCRAFQRLTGGRHTLFASNDGQAGARLQTSVSYHASSSWSKNGHLR